MKKALLLLASAALLFAGCQKEQVAVTETDGDQVTVTFTAGLTPEGTKATTDNDGAATKVNHWVLEVRDAQDDLFYVEERNDVTPGTLQQTYELKLFKNQSYTLQFWADTKGAYNTDDLTAVSAKDAVANKDSRDAFSANVPYTSLVSESKNVTLTRPFAQLNIITCDLDELQSKVIALTYAKYAPTSLNVIASVPATFNVKTQQAGEASEQTLTATASYADFIAGAPETTLFMDYIFASAGEADIVAVKFSSESEKNSISYDFANIPLQRNYRTNIKGNLMSNDSEWTVTIDPQWNTPEYVEERWAAGMVTPVTPDEEGVYTINRPSELAWIAQQVNAGNTFEGKTVKLAKDIDLNNGRWTPIGDATHSFKGTFDGQANTIKNLNVNLGESSVNAGLFSWLNNGTIRDVHVNGAEISVVGGAAGVIVGKMYSGGTVNSVTVKNAKIEGNHYLGGIAGTIYGSVTNCAVENLIITAKPNPVGDSYDNGDKCGGIVGFSQNDNMESITGNLATNVTITGYRDLGGIVGAAGCSNTVIKENRVVLSSITADQTVNSYGEMPFNAGIIVGRVLSGSVDASNTSENVTVNCALADGLSFNPEAKELVVSNAKGLDAVRNFLTSDYCTNADYRIYDSYSTVLFSIKLMNDISLTDAWTPIATADNQSIHFDGNSKTISGLNVSGANYAGLFEGGRDQANEFDFKKLTIDGATITGVDGKYAGAFMAWGGKQFHFEDCALTNSSVSAAKYTAGFVGFSNAPITGFKNLTVDACTITGAHDRATGGIIGHNQGEADLTFDNVVVSNTAITSTVAGSVGGIIGRFGVAGRNDVLHYINCSVNGVATAEAFCGQRLDNGDVDIQ